MAEYSERFLKALFEDLPKDKDEEEMERVAEWVRGYQKLMKNVASWQRNNRARRRTRAELQHRNFNVTLHRRRKRGSSRALGSRRSTQKAYRYLLTRAKVCGLSTSTPRARFVSNNTTFTVLYFRTMASEE